MKFVLGLILHTQRAISKSETYGSTPPGPGFQPNSVADRSAAPQMLHVVGTVETVKKREKKKPEKKGRNSHNLHLSLSRTPALTFPTFVSLEGVEAASVCLISR